MSEQEKMAEELSTSCLKRKLFTAGENISKIMTPDWIDTQNAVNEWNLKHSAKIQYPFWKIVSNKHVKVEYNFESTEIRICFEHDGFGGLSMPLQQWKQLKVAAEKIIDFGEALKNNPKEIKTILPNIQQITIKNDVWDFARVIFDEAYAFEIRWKNETNCLVDLRFGTCDEWTDYAWFPSPAPHILISLMGFMYFAKILVPRVDAGIDMWKKMTEGAKGCWFKCVPPSHRTKEPLIYSENPDQTNQDIFPYRKCMEIGKNYTPNASPQWRDGNNPINIKAVWREAKSKKTE